MSTAPHSLAVVRQRVSSGSPLEPTIGFSRAVLTGAKSSSPPPQRFGRTVTLIRIPASRHAVVSRSSTRRFASRARHSLTSCVRGAFLVDRAHGTAVAQVHGEVFGDSRPASGFIVVKGFLDPRWLVEIEADAIVR
jgi:hypothetical protein